jgi:hypothetical protein
MEHLMWIAQSHIELIQEEGSTILLGFQETVQPMPNQLEINWLSILF